MKKLSLILIIIIIFGLFAGCEGIGDTLPENGGEGKNFEFSYEIEKREFLRGEEIKIKAIVKNISGKVQRYTGCSSYDYFPHLELYWLTDSGEVGGMLHSEPMMFPADVVEKTIKKGELGSHTYTFLIPNDAECTDYSITLSRGGESCTFENILRISQDTSSDILPSEQKFEAEKQADKFAFSFALDKTEYRRGEVISIYAKVTNVSGEDHVYTGSSSEYMPGIILYWTAENGGIGGRLEHDPYVMTEDIVTRTIKNGETGGIVYKFYIPNDAKCTAYSISLSYNAEVAVFDDVIRIVEDNAIAESGNYQYCSTSVISGGAEINPIKVSIGYSEYKNNELFDTVEIAGFEYIFSSSDYNVSEFPKLVLDGDISALPPVNVSISNVRVYDVYYNRSDLTFDSISELSRLPAGEYVIIYNEEADGRGCDPEIKDFRINKSVGVFKLVITVPSFSFAEVSQMYRENTPGVKTEGFKNISEAVINDKETAAERAKNECTIGYNAVRVAYDSKESVWEITFSTEGVPGGCQSVYLDKNGVTILIVYGE